MSRFELDVPELVVHLDSKRAQAGQTWRDLGHELGIAPSIFSRMKSGRRPDADALVTLIAWLDIDLSCVTKPKERTP